MVRTIEECPFLTGISQILKDVRAEREKLDPRTGKAICLEIVQFELEQALMRIVQQSREVWEREKSIINGITEPSQIRAVIDHFLHPAA